MKSTGEAIGYDRSLKRALYKALQASGVNVANYGTIFVTIADPDKEEALPLIRRFYNLGFNIEATAGHRRLPEGARHPDPHPPQDQRGQRGDPHLSAAGPCQLCHQHQCHRRHGCGERRI